MVNEEQKKEVVQLCRELIRRRSYSGQEAGAADALADFMRGKGFDEVFIDRYGSVVGSVRGKRPGPGILFDGHIDTVPVVDVHGWKHDPFGGEAADGRIYGRGASDMKGATAAMACAAANFAKATGRDFAGTVHVAGVVFEELFEGVAAREISARVKPEFVVIGEASELNLKIGQRGRAEIVLETAGVPAHSANPEKGVNAVHAMIKLIAEVERIVPGRQPVLGKGVSVLTDIISTPYPGASVVPSGCRVTYDRRLLVGETREAVIAPYREAAERLAAADPAFRGTASFARGKEKCHTGDSIEGERFFPGWLFGADAEFVRKALAGLRSVGLEPEISHYSFCTNGSHYAGEAGIKTLGFGPSRENLAHTTDEYIEETQLYAALDGYQAISKALLEA
ncbi:MAG: YgeY family selenium metabolism-linked hydrolase [Planctomycetota bacterium]|jgi:putative selenium metabolism hydrolase|nr:YgeY family selenium metabolism-linked hydrolase [Planctomycetota bacterium]